MEEQQKQQEICEHEWKEYENNKGEIAYRECCKCWAKEKLENGHWKHIRSW